MRILITGGFGYLGARIAEKLNKNGYKVVLGSQRDLKVPDWLPNAEVVRTVWSDEARMRNICKNVDVIIHAAGMNARNCEKDPLSATKFNGLSTINLIQSAIFEKVRRFFFLSTAHVYGSPLEGIIDEKTPALNTHPYSYSNLVAEYALTHEISINHIEGASLRISNVFGPPKDPRNNCWMLWLMICVDKLLQKVK